MSNKKVFLLGGKDLEMMEIKNLLSSKNQIFEEKDLSWENAKLSAYQEELKKYENDNVTIYGIELEADIKLSKNYEEIDHHGKNDDKPSSLEQVAKILNIELSREQKLIAANDSRYISGMKSLCATKKEIDDIRKKDREAQGITEEDELLAKESFETSCNNNSNLIYSKTSKFSALSDFAYEKFDNYVIYNDSKVVFYGYKKDNILEFLKSQNIDEKNYYYGGGEFGFVGIKENVLDKEKIKSLIEEFEKLNLKENLYSYHTFMFPFTFCEKFDKKTNWEYKHFEINAQASFNEYVYFYKHIQDAIYNKDEQANEKWISKYYEYKKQKGTYTINCKKGIFELELDGLSLRIFNTNVAILAFNLKNTKYFDEDSVLAINDFGRRIYPQFLGENFTCDTKKAILPNHITLTLDNEVIKEDFERFNKIDNLRNSKKLNLLPSFISELIENNFLDKDNKKTNIRPIIDDRMFVISQYMNDELVNNLKVFKGTEEYEYENNDFWYKYIFIDGDGKTCQSKHMTKKLISEATYDRWVEWGTLFGISRYSFVALTGSWYGKNILLPHMQTMYFQIFTLLLAYRATIIKFSDEIQNVTNETSQNLEKLSKDTKEIYKNYLDFLNKLYFKEVTAQDQGIELYNQAMKIMDIEKYMSDLDHEVNQLHTYVDMLEEKSRNDKLGFISKMGAVLLPPSLLAGLFGMNVLMLEESFLNQTVALLLIIFSGIVGFIITSEDINKNKDCSFKGINETFIDFRNFFLPIFVILFILFLIFSDKKDKSPQETIITNQPIEVNLSDKKGENK